MGALALLLVMEVLGAAPLEVVVLVDPSDAEGLGAAVEAQLMGLEVSVRRQAPPPHLEGSAHTQLRAVRAALLGSQARVAVWFEVASGPPRVHVADLLRSRHTVRQVPRDSGTQEAMALIARASVVALLTNEHAAPAAPEPPSLRPPRWSLEVAANWGHSGVGSQYTPGLELGLVRELVGRWGLALGARVEPPVVVEDEWVRLSLQRFQGFLGAQGALVSTGRFLLDVRAGVAVRPVRVEPSAVASSATTPGALLSVDWAAAAKVRPGFRLGESWWLGAEVCLEVPLISSQYYVQLPEGPHPVASGPRLEARVGLGVAYAFL